MAYLGNAPGVESQRLTTTFTATDGQTAFNPVGGYTLGYVDAYLNGVKLIDGTDYTAADGVTVTLTSGAALNDNVELVTYTPRGLSDGYTKTEADGRYVQPNDDVTLGDVTVDSFTSTGIDDNATSTAITIDASENVGIGTTSPTSFGGGYKTLEAQGSTTSDGGVFRTSTSDSSVIGDFYSYSGGVILEARSTNPLRFHTNNVERARIDSSGNLLVGTTDAAAGVGNANSGIILGSNNSSVFSRSGASGQPTMYINKNTNDGTLVQFNKDGATVGSIGANSGDIYIASSGTFSAGLMFEGSSGAQDIRPCSKTGSLLDAAIDLGDPSARFKDLYLSGGVYLGGTDAANKLDDYEEGTWTPSADSNITITTVHNATYTRVGDAVTINAWFKAYANSASFVIGGLPYTISGRTTASLSNVFESEVISNQALSTSIYGYGVTTSGVQRDWFLSFSYKI